MDNTFFTIIGLILANIIAAVWAWNRTPRPKPVDVPASTPTDPEIAEVAIDAVGPAIDTPEPPPPPLPQKPGTKLVDKELPSFIIAHGPVAEIEGGYQAHPADRGNYNSKGQLVGTNWGIAAPVAEQYFRRVVTKEDMQKLSRSVAHDIFRRMFWDKMRGNQFPNQRLANIVYDGHVNHGGWGIKLLQRVAGLKEDGVVGPVTLAAINAADQPKLYQAYYNARKDFYHAIVRNRPDQKAFLKGWLKRLAYYE